MTQSQSNSEAVQNLLIGVENLKEPTLLEEFKTKFSELGESEINRTLSLKYHQEKIYQIKMAFPKVSNVKEIHISYTIVNQKKQENQILNHQQSQSSEKEKQLKFDKIHELNDLKDMCDILFGKLAEIEGKAVQELHREFGVI